MTSATCVDVRRQLGAFVDGALPGAEMLAVSQHLASCRTCTDEVQDTRDLGDTLRAVAARLPAPTELGGLAGGVVSRVLAEQAQSWMATFARASEDWHWVIVGAGSVAAAFVSAMLATVVILVGPAPAREDSLAALLQNLGSPAGTLFVLATPVGNDKDSMVMQFDNGGTQETGPGTVMPADFAPPTESDLVRALDSSLVTADGRISDVRNMSDRDRRYTESLLDQLSRFRFAGRRDASGRLTVLQIGLVANTSVTAKPL
jgi:hypothetical protein